MLGGTDAQVVVEMVGIQTIPTLVIEMQFIQRMSAINMAVRFKDNVKNAMGGVGFSVRPTKPYTK